jgi:peptidylprolyl isomerase
MKKITLILLTISFCGLTACKTGTKKGGDMDKETLVKIETTAGDIKVKLYNETPKHRDNFIKLVKDGVYEGTLFHRVIKDFMIQAGDPDSKNAPKGKMLGAGDVGYTVPAEFVYPKYFHKKGALSAARQGDNVNPKKESSGWFYTRNIRGYPPGIGHQRKSGTRNRKGNISRRPLSSHQ